MSTMNNIFVVVDSKQPRATMLGVEPRFSYCIKADPYLIEQIINLPNQTPSPTGLVFRFGRNKEYYQTWSNSLSLKEQLINLGLQEILGESQIGLKFHDEWTRTLQNFLKDNERYIQIGKEHMMDRFI